MVIKAIALKDGPYQIEGTLEVLELTDAEGNRYDLMGKKRIFLCRCGASETKPFCDGHHSQIGFRAAEAAAMAERKT